MKGQKKDVDTNRYYEIFGVPKTATTEEIRKSYRKLVMKLHPDKGGDPAKFQEMQNAYEVLSDPQKRQIYDNYGEEGLKEGMGGGQDFDPFSFFGGFGGGQRQNVRRKCKGKLIQLPITLEEAYNGATKEVSYERRIICPKCKGTGSNDPNAQTKCSTCQGKGSRVVIQKMGNMIMQTQKTCEDCKGEGFIIKDKCKECKAEKVKMEKIKTKVHIDKGVPDGHRYVKKDEGDQYPDVDNGDLVFEIEVKKHKDFVRKGADLYYKCEISLLQALTGLKFVVTHLDGRKILIFTKPDEIIEPQKLKTVKELGMPFFESPYRFGNLYFDFQIIFPNSLKPEEVKKLDEILKHERLHKVKDLPKDAEKYFLTEYKDSEANTDHKGGRKEEYDEDDDFDGQAHRTVQCGNQ